MDQKHIIIYAIVVFCVYTATANINLDIYEKSAKVKNHELNESLSEENENEALSRTKRQLMIDDFNYAIFGDNNTILVKLNLSDPIQQSVIDELQEEIRSVFVLLYPNYTVEFQVEAEIVTATSSATETTSLSTAPFTTYSYSSKETQTSPETDPSTTTNPETANFISTTPLAIETTHGEGSIRTTTTHTLTDAVKASETYSMGTTDSPTTTNGDISTAETSDVMSTVSDKMSTTNPLTTADLRTNATGITPPATTSVMTTTMPDAMTTTMADATTTTMSDAISTTVPDAMTTTMSDVMATATIHDVTSTTAPDITTMVSDAMSTTAPDSMSTMIPDVMTTTASNVTTSKTSDDITIMSVTEITHFSEDPTSRSMTSAEQSTSSPTIAEESTASTATSDSMSSTLELTTNEVTSSGETSAESTVVTDEDSVTTEEVSAEPAVTTETYEAKNFTFDIELANETFTSNLSNSSSQEYQTLKLKVETALENVLTLSSIRKIEVDGFNDGSVIAVVNIEADESVTKEDIINNYQNSNSMEKSIFASSGLRSIDTPTTSTTTATIPSEVTTTPAVTTTTAKAESQPLSDGAIVGIVLGSLFGATTIIILIVFVVRRYHLGCSEKSEYDMRGKDYGQMPGLDELYHQSSAEEAV